MRDAMASDGTWKLQERCLEGWRTSTPPTFEAQRRGMQAPHFVRSQIQTRQDKLGELGASSKLKACISCFDDVLLSPSDHRGRPHAYRGGEGGCKREEIEECPSASGQCNFPDETSSRYPHLFS